jgi:transcriptional regulator with XRE-family HTH domain
VWVQPREHKIVGACLADARRRANLTQQELAKRLGKPPFVSDYERGQRRIDLMELLLIARALSVDPQERCYLTFGNGARCAIECHEDGDGRTAMLSTALAMAPRHPFGLTSSHKGHRAAQAAALELFAHRALELIADGAKSVLHRPASPRFFG